LYAGQLMYFNGTYLNVLRPADKIAIIVSLTTESTNNGSINSQHIGVLYVCYDTIRYKCIYSALKSWRQAAYLLHCTIN